MSARPRETDTVRAILQYLHLHQILAWRMNTGAVKMGRRFLRFGHPGMSDIIGVRTGSAAVGPGVERGQFLAIEVKTTKGRISLAQQAFLDQITAAGGTAFVARSVQDVQRELGLP